MVLEKAAVSSFRIALILTMEAAGSSGTVANIYETTRYHIQEELCSLPPL
jgi:Na+-translocating ferredoxin:NAD+ oxidoreductase RnfG subunit